jgi:membrane protein YqaA with SNARE-associated domain
MNKKEAGELEDRPQASRMSGMNMMMGMMVACCIAAIVFSSIAGGGFGWWLGRSSPQPANSPSNSSQPQK